LRESIEARFAEESAEKTRTNKEEALLNELLNHVEVDLPETMIEREVNYMINQTAMQLQNQGIDVNRLFTRDMIERMQQQSRPDAIKRLKRTLALGEIAKAESITTDEAEISAKTNELLEDLTEAGRTIDPDRLRSVIAEDVLKEKIMDWLIEHSSIELVPEGTLVQEQEMDAVEALPSASPEVDEPSEEESSAAPAEAELALETVADSSATLEENPTVEAAEPAEAAPKKKRATKKATDASANVQPEAEATAETAEAKPKTRKSTKKAKSAGDE
jgi:trigger factor